MIMLDGQYLRVGVTPLEGVRLVASRKGFYDVDVQPFPDCVKIVCSGEKNTFTAKGRDLQEACDSAVRKLWL